MTWTLSQPDAPHAPATADIPAQLAAARTAQQRWAESPLSDRLLHLRRFRHLLADRADDLVAALAHLPNRDARTSLVAEILPLADACKFLERTAARTLAPRRYGSRGRPVWLGRVALEVRREPLGTVLILAPANYPLFLPGVQILGALAAGNAAVLKPGTAGTPPMTALRDLLLAAGIDPQLLPLLDESPQSATAAMDAGVEKVFLTGSANTGRAVLRQLADSATPAVMELSGCDAVFITRDADLARTAKLLAFGVTFNGGSTCIAPRRVFVPHHQLAELQNHLARELAARPPIHLAPRAAHTLQHTVNAALTQGATLAAGRIDGAAVTPLVLTHVTPHMAIAQADLMAPVLSLIPVHSDLEALAAAALCPYALGAAIFGDTHAAESLADRIHAGVVTINDLIVPTADPRLPFAGRKHSGFGVTRGTEGLLEFTQTKAIATRRGTSLPHLQPPHPTDAALFTAFLQLTHTRGLRAKARAAASLLKTLLSRNNASKDLNP